MDVNKTTSISLSGVHSKVRGEKTKVRGKSVMLQATRKIIYNSKRQIKPNEQGPITAEVGEASVLYEQICTTRKGKYNQIQQGPLKSQRKKLKRKRKVYPQKQVKTRIYKLNQLNRVQVEMVREGNNHKHNQI